MAFYLASILTYFLAYILTFLLAINLASILAFLSSIYSGILSDILSSIHSGSLSGILSGMSSGPRRSTAPRYAGRSRPTPQPPELGILKFLCSLIPQPCHLAIWRSGARPLNSLLGSYSTDPHGVRVQAHSPASGAGDMSECSKQEGAKRRRGGRRRRREEEEEEEEEQEKEEQSLSSNLETLNLQAGEVHDSLHELMVGIAQPNQDFDPLQQHVLSQCYSLQAPSQTHHGLMLRANGQVCHVRNCQGKRKEGRDQQKYCEKQLVSQALPMQLDAIVRSGNKNFMFISIFPKPPTLKKEPQESVPPQALCQ